MKILLVPREETMISPSSSVFQVLHRIWFRPQRGGLEESMAHAKAIWDMEDLARRLETTPDKIDFIYLGWDSRVFWDTWMVTVDGQAVGFTNGNVRDYEKKSKDSETDSNLVEA